MAREVRLWIAATLGVCCVVAVIYLPLRGAQASTRSTPFSTQLSQATPARLRAQALADEWRTREMTTRLAEERVRVRARVAGSTTSESVVLLVPGWDSSQARLQARLGPALDSAWHSLGLSTTKISVGVVIDPADGRSATETPKEELSLAFLLPDSSNRTTCVARLPVNIGLRNAMAQDESSNGTPWFRQWLRGVLGPCAFFAAYGTPSRSVRSWLGSRGYDLALYPNWDDSTASGRSVRRALLQIGDDKVWWWDYIYHQSSPAVACLAGRSAGCREAVLAGSGDDARTTSYDIVRPDRHFWNRQRLIGGTLYLSDVAREVGRERFLEFWNSPLPVDTALARALRRPVGDWTAAWQRRLVGSEFRLGPTAPASASLLAALLAGVAIAAVVLTAQRRQGG